jgi:hypothetical protein
MFYWHSHSQWTSHPALQERTQKHFDAYHVINILALYKLITVWCHYTIKIAPAAKQNYSYATTTAHTSDSPPPLPPGWVAGTDPMSGCIYLANPSTGQTSWEAPTLSKPLNELESISVGKIADMCHAAKWSILQQTLETSPSWGTTTPHGGGVTQNMHCYSWQSALQNKLYTTLLVTADCKKN